MPRERDGFIPLGDVTEAVELPGNRALTNRAAAPSSATSLHPARPGDAARGRERSGRAQNFVVD